MAERAARRRLTLVGSFSSSDADPGQGTKSARGQPLACRAESWASSATCS